MSAATAEVPELRRPPPERARPVVVSIPHAGSWFPPDELPLYATAPERLLLDSDLFVDALYADCEELGATVVATPVHRFVVDVNRLPDDLSPLSVQGAERRTDAGYYGDRGLFWAVTTRGEAVYLGPMPPHQAERRIARWYEPYHAALRGELLRLRERFGRVALIDAHSMPSEATRAHADAGATRPDVVPGDLDGASCGAWLSKATADFWRARGYRVSPNQPYRGGGITRRHGSPPDGIHAIQVELNRSLYMDEERLERAAGFDSLRRDCREFVRRVIEAVSVESGA